jgi:class 3 adenylate cyclase
MTVSIIALSITAYLSFSYAEQILKDRINDQLTSESTVRGDSIAFLLETRVKETQILSTDPMIRILVKELDENIGSPEFERISNEKRRDFLIQIQAFQELVGFSIGFEDVKIIGKDGTVFFTLGRLEDMNLSNNPEFLRGINGEEFFKFVPSSNNKKLMIVAPIYGKDSKHNDGPIGVIIAQMRTAQIDSILLNRGGLGKTGEVYLVNEDRLMISESRFIENAIFNQPSDTLPVDACFSSASEYIGPYVDYRGVPTFGSSYCKNNLGFVLLAKMDRIETIQPITTLQNRILETGLAITAGMAIVAFILSKSLSRPLIKLKNAAIEVTNGNFSVRTNIKTKDEIGALSSSFDSMAKKLQESLFEIKAKEDVIKQQEEILLNFSDHSENDCVCLIDIKDSTKIAAHLSDNETGKLYGIFLNYMASIVKKYNGTVVKNIGDALLFCFPRVDPQDVDIFRNVIECCLALCESHQTINQKLDKEGLPQINYKVSATYGSVRVAKVTRSEVNDIFGSAVNRCAKINSMAPTNGVVIGEALYTSAKYLQQYNFAKINEAFPDKYEFSVFTVTRKR